MTDTSSLVAEFESAHASGVGDPWEMLGRATRALAEAEAGVRREVATSDRLRKAWREDVAEAWDEGFEKATSLTASDFWSDAWSDDHNPYRKASA